MESIVVKVENNEEVWGSVKREPELGPELLQSPDVASPRAGSSEECCEVGTEMSIGANSYPEIPVIQGLKLEPDCVKQEEEEKEEEWCGVREGDAKAGLYAGHAVKDELVLGPEQLQAPDVAFALKGTSGEQRTASLVAERTSSECHGEGLPSSESRGPQLVVRLVRIPDDDDKHPDTRMEKLRVQSTLTPRQRRVKRVSRRHRHKKIHTVVECHRCDVCDRRFSTSDRLKIHSHYHTGVKPYTCDICNEQFISVWKFGVHKRAHKRDKLHSCDLCNKRFGAMSSLVKHKRIHTIEKPFKCDFCEKAFALRTNLVIHKRIHPREKPTACSICNEQFTQSDPLSSHICIHTGEKTHICNICYEQFSRKYSLRKHILTHHSTDKKYVRRDGRPSRQTAQSKPPSPAISSTRTVT